MIFVVSTTSPTGYSCDCVAGYTKVGQDAYGVQSCLPNALAVEFVNTELTNSKVTYYDNGKNIIGSVTSLVVLHYFTTGASRCKHYSSAADIVFCQQLANLCTLQMFDFTYGACKAFNDIGVGRGVNLYGLSTWHNSMPLLVFPQLVGATALATCKDKSLQMQMSLRGKMMNFIVSKFSINGTWLGYNNVSTLFQYCKVAPPNTHRGGGTSSNTRLGLVHKVHPQALLLSFSLKS